MAYTFNPFTGNFDDQGPAPLGTSTNPFPASGEYQYDETGTKLFIRVIRVISGIAHDVLIEVVVVTNNAIFQDGNNFIFQDGNNLIY